MSLWFRAALLPTGWAEDVRLSVDRGTITAVAADVPPGPADDRGDVALPGVANVHSHAFQRGMSGLAEVRGPGADTFWTWREVMYRFLDRVGPGQMEAIAAMAYAEMLEAGFTRVGEFHYVHHDPAGRPYANPGEMAERVCAAAATAGVGMTLLPSFYAHGNFGGQPPTPGQRRFITSVDEFSRLVGAAERLPGVTVGVAPHSLRAVTADELRAVVAMAGQRPVHVHAAEQVREVEDCLAATGTTPVRWLLDHAGVDGRWCLIHATHVTADEVAALAAGGATAGLCPVTEANLGDGTFPAEAFAAAGGRFGVGTDSNVRIGVADELRQLEYAQRLAHRRRNVLAGPGGSTGRAVFSRASAGGGRAVGHPFVGLAAGGPADVVELAAGYDSLTARERGDAVLDRFVFGRAAVGRVWVAGRRVVADGRHVGRAAIEAAFRRAMRHVLA